MVARDVECAQRESSERDTYAPRALTAQRRADLQVHINFLREKQFIQPRENKAR